MVCPSVRQRRRARAAARRSASRSAPSAAAPSASSRLSVPSDCAYLASAREHPPAAVVRQQQRDVELLVQFMRDFSERQSQLFFLIAHLPRRATSRRSCSRSSTMTSRKRSAALAATFETAARGVIYEHRPASLPAERLVAALKPVLAEAGQARRIGRSSATRPSSCGASRKRSREVRALDPANRRAFLDLLGRVMRG